MNPLDARFSLPLAQIEHVRDQTGANQKVHSGSVNFSEVLEGVVASTNEKLRISGGSKEAFAAGVRDDIHGTMIAMTEADIQLRLVSTARNKIVDAFYELWRMQI